MRKFLSLFAAVLVALVANAAVINITNANADALRLALNSAQTGDIIEMAAGTYVESNSDYIAFAGKEVTVRAAEGAEVLIQPKVSVTLSEGAKARFENIKFDVSHLIELASWYEHLIYPTDATENRLELEGCEFYGFNLNKSMIYCSSSNKLSAITVNNCYFHDCMKSLIFVENTADMNAQIKNSTFANISTNTESYWAGVIDIRATGATLLVDHCTFYNVIPMNTDYSCVSKVTLANGVASNCIFMLPTAQDGIRAMRGVTANNCITFNYLKDSGTGIHSSVTKNNCVQEDPLFVDAANGNFTLGEGSPALTLNDGQPIGDPRWAVAPTPVTHTYTIAGSSEVAFGTIWASANTANDMEMNDDGIYVWERTGLTLPAGSIEFKVCEDHGWDVAYPGSNYQLAIPEAGIYTIWIHFDPANGNAVTANATKTGDAVVIPTIAMHGNFLGSWADTENFTVAEGNATASLTLTIAAGNYEFGMRIGGSGNWTANGAAFTRENPSAVIAAGSGNLTLAADAAGEYIFTWTYETNTLAITFPAVTPQPVGEWAEVIWTEPADKDAIAADATFTVVGSEFSAQITDPDNKMAIDANTARFGTPEAFTDYTHRLKTGGKSSATKNFITLNIPESGVLRIAVRTGSNNDTTRTLVVKQGETELYNQVVKEADKTVVTDGENSTNYYPYITVNVAAGSVVLSYPINGLNFYAIGFKAGAAPQPADPTVSVRGTMNEWGETPFELSADKTYATLTIDDIPAGDYQFKMFINGEWRSNGYTFHRGFTGAAGITGNDDNNMVFQADVRGAYTFTWTFANDSLGFIYPEEPQPQGCDWDAIDFLGDGSPEQTFGNQFKVCKEGDVPGVVNIQKPGFAAETGIYVTFPSAAFGEISLAEGQYVIDGAGMVLYLSAFTAQETEVSVVCEGNTYVFTVYNALGGAPELNYYMKNNWDAGADWTWKAMTKDGENYKLENVVFGGTGVNYNTAESDEGSSWVPVANIAGDAISAKDTVTLVLDPAAGTVTATLIGKYVDPNPDEHTYTVAGSSDVAFGTAWDPTNAHNDMVLNGVGIYLWEKTELTLPEGTIKFKVCEDHAWDVAYPAQDYELAIPETGVYTINIAFNPDTKEVTANATKTGDATVTVDYYLVGSAKGWEAKAENIFTLNAEAGEGIEEYKIETTLEVGEGLKVLSSTGAWYPDGMGNEYVVDQDHAGATTIYFRPAGNAEWAAFGGYMYVVQTGGAGIDAVDANAPAVKVLHNGQILIKKGDKTYNIMGAIVR